MNEPVHIRRYVPGEEGLLFDVYFTAIHLIASQDYTAEQIEAWAPRSLEAAMWQKRMPGNMPLRRSLKG